MFNTSLNRKSQGDLVKDLRNGDAQAKNVAAIVQIVRPEVLLLNEFDYDADGEALGIFMRDYLGVSQDGYEAIEYEYHFVSPVNTGVLSGWDYNKDGKVELPLDGYGFGSFPGQYGMVLLSMYEIDTERIRTFQKFRWIDMPCAVLPFDQNNGMNYYDPVTCANGESEMNTFRLSSKNHWDVPITIDTQVYHVLAAHPTPPVFDDGDFCNGKIDWNGRRNHDEIRFWSDYTNDDDASSDYIYDDNGTYGGIERPGDSKFVILGDHNADSVDGDSYEFPAKKFFTENKMMNNCVVPESDGAVEYYENDSRGCGIKKIRTSEFGLRVDYVLPSANICIVDSGVFWPAKSDPQSRYLHIEGGKSTSDHRMVWVDVTDFAETMDLGVKKARQGIERS